MNALGGALDQIPSPTVDENLCDFSLIFRTEASIGEALFSGLFRLAVQCSIALEVVTYFGHKVHQSIELRISLVARPFKPGDRQLQSAHLFVDLSGVQARCRQN